MKTLGPMLSCVAAVLLSVHAAGVLEITTKKQSFPERNLSVERTYRGGKCIMLEMTQDGKRTRAFRVNGRTVAVESDEDQDGFYETFVVFDPETDEFEWFIRTTNHVVHPVASEKLQELKEKKRKADKALADLIEKSR